MCVVTLCARCQGRGTGRACPAAGHGCPGCSAN